MGSKTATANRNRDRAASTEQLMKNIMTGGEISKAREAELQKAADYGRGIQFVQGSPTVKGLTQAGGKPVFRTGATAADYTGRITATPPTFMELLGDAKRALVGGQAPTPSFAQSTRVAAPDVVAGPNAVNYAGFLPTPREVTGIVPALAEKFMVPGGIAFGIAKDLFQRFYPGQEEETVTPAARPGMVFPASIPSVTGETVDLRTPTIEELVITPVSESGDVTVSGRPDMNIPVSLADYQTLDQLPNEGSYVAQPSYTSEQDTKDFYNHLILNRGKSPEEAMAIIQDLSLPMGTNFANGGAVPPARGPMSQGVASLFKNK